jgi:hypothetical protein
LKNLAKAGRDTDASFFVDGVIVRSAEHFAPEPP